MAGVIGIYGLIVSVIISSGMGNQQCAKTGFANFGAGLAVGTSPSIAPNASHARDGPRPRTRGIDLERSQTKSAAIQHGRPAGASCVHSGGGSSHAPAPRRASRV